MNSGGAGVVLAAGSSGRMGRPKMLLPYGGGTFLSSVVEGLAGAGLAPLVVVVSSEEVAAAARQLPVQVVHNPAPERGQLSSLQCALRELRAVPFVILALGDHPAVRPETYRALAFAQEEEPAAAHLPRWGERRGHPVALPRPLLDALAALPPEASAEPTVEAFRPLIEVPVDDPGVVLDIDTPQDLGQAYGTRP